MFLGLDFGAKKKVSEWERQCFPNREFLILFYTWAEKRGGQSGPQQDPHHHLWCNSLWWNLVNITFRCDSWDLAFRKTCRKALQTSGHNLLRLSEGWFEQGGVICLEKNRVQHCFPYFLIRQYGLEEAARGKVNFRSQGGRIKVLPRLNFWAAKTRSCRWKIEEQSKSRARNKTFWQPWRPFNYISTWRSLKIIQFHLPSLLFMEALFNQIIFGHL